MEIIIEKLNEWWESLLALVPNFVMAVAVLTAFVVISRVATYLIRKAMQRTGQRPVLVNLFSTVVKIAVIAIGLFYALSMVGLQKTVMSLLAGAGIIGLALGFAFQDLAENFIAGILMTFRKPFKIGNIIETHDYMGTVTALSFRSTALDTFSGQHVLIPNKEVYHHPIVNYSHNGHRRIEIGVGVGYETDLKLATKTAINALKSLDCLVEDKPVQAFALEFGDSSINFSLRYWVSYPDNKNFFQEIHNGVLAIKSAFDREDINIPFPIRTLDFSKSEQSPLNATARKIEFKQE